MIEEDIAEKSVRIVAQLTAERLLRFGWCQGYFSDGEGRCCLYGALARAHRDSGLAQGSYPLDQVMKRIQALTGVEIIHWNDAAGRTFEEVLSIVNRVAAGEGC